MAVSDFTIRISGTVAYNDNSHGSFEASAIWKGNLGGVVAQHNNAASLENFRQLFLGKAANINSVLDVLAPSTAAQGEVTFTTAAPSVPKTVTSFVLEISGLASYDNNTRSSFVAQWVNGVVNLFPAETLSTWDDMTLATGANTPRVMLTTIFEAVAGAGNISIS